jgi:SAM-dependent methyltransferase
MSPGDTDHSPREPDFEQTQVFRRNVAFGVTTTQYNEYRATYPAELFKRLEDFGIPQRNDRILDVGTGTGFLGAELATGAGKVVGADTDRGMLQQIQESQTGDSKLSSVQADAEHLPFRPMSFDVVTAGQCWHWFDRDAAASEAHRVLTPTGSLVITHFDWLPRPRNVVEATEELVLEMNPDWPMSGGTGFYEEWPEDVYAVGFDDVETFTFDICVSYSHEAWRGRMQASAGVGASMNNEDAREFDERLKTMLESQFPTDPLKIRHRSFSLVCRKPASDT